MKKNRRIENFINKRNYYYEKHPILLIILLSITFGFFAGNMKHFFSLNLIALIALIPQIYLLFKNLSFRLNLKY